MTAFALCLPEGAAASPSRDLRGGLSSSLRPAARTRLTAHRSGVPVAPTLRVGCGACLGHRDRQGQVPLLHPDLRADCPGLAPGPLLTPDPTGGSQPLETQNVT